MSRTDIVAIESRAGVSKQDIREQIWDYMEAQNLADFPRPVHHRIPNFKCLSLEERNIHEKMKIHRISNNVDKGNQRGEGWGSWGSYLACQNIKDLEVFPRTQEVKVDPDKPLEGVRLLALQSKKTLLVPTPRLRTGLFNRITPPPGATKDILRKCATSQGVRNYSVPVGLDARVLVDLVVVGSVAVSEKGWRIGKGEGYADLEYAMMASMGAVSQGTPVVTIVHDCQVVDIPESLLEDHDLTVDYILTPTRVIATGCERPKPTGIMWSKINREMMEKIPVLRSLHCREKQAGKCVTLQDEHQHPVEGCSQHTAPRSAVRRPWDPPEPESCSMQAQDVPSNTVYVGNLPPATRVSELKRALRERGAAPLRLTWRGPQNGACLHYQDLDSAQRAVSCLQGLHLGANALRVVLARQQRASDPVSSLAGKLHPDHYPTI